MLIETTLGVVPHVQCRQTEWHTQRHYRLSACSARISAFDKTVLVTGTPSRAVGPASRNLSGITASVRRRRHQETNTAWDWSKKQREIREAPRTRRCSLSSRNSPYGSIQTAVAPNTPSVAVTTGGGRQHAPSNIPIGTQAMVFKPWQYSSTATVSQAPSTSRFDKPMYSTVAGLA